MRNNYLLLALAAVAGYLIYKKSKASKPIITVDQPRLPQFSPASQQTNPNYPTGGYGNTGEPGGGRRGIL
jgi:hypothetical protein